MKKVLIYVLLTLNILCFSGCTVKPEDQEETTVTSVKQTEIPEESEESTTKIIDGVSVRQINNDMSEVTNYSVINKGDYFLFTTTNEEIYVMFLDNLDEFKYEIVEISLDIEKYDYWYVTYKKK